MTPLSGAQCHGAKQGGRLDMSTKAAAYENLVGKPADGPCDGTPGEVCGCGTSGKTRVVAGKAEESLIIERLTVDRAAFEPTEFS